MEYGSPRVKLTKSSEEQLESLGRAFAAGYSHSPWLGANLEHGIASNTIFTLKLSLGQILALQNVKSPLLITPQTMASNYRCCRWISKQIYAE